MTQLKLPKNYIVSLLRQVEVDLTTIKHNCTSYNMSQDVDQAMTNLNLAIAGLEDDTFTPQNTTHKNNEGK